MPSTSARASAARRGQCGQLELAREAAQRWDAPRSPPPATRHRPHARTREPVEQEACVRALASEAARWCMRQCANDALDRRSTCTWIEGPLDGREKANKRAVSTKMVKSTSELATGRPTTTQTH
eukprot:3345788-Pleurochrysis_carterae.AAC.2